MKNKGINAAYESFWGKDRKVLVYPTEFVVRIFLAVYPGLNYDKPSKGSRVLDMGHGDGRNTVFLCQQGYDVSGVEITEEIVRLAEDRLVNYGLSADLRVGRNSAIPFDNHYFDYVLSCHCCYYCDDNEVFSTNMSEYSRVMRPGGWLIASVADCSSYIFDSSEVLTDGTRMIKVDPYENRIGYRLFCVESKETLSEALSAHFCNVQVGHASNEYFGISERVYWVVAQKR